MRRFGERTRPATQVTTWSPTTSFNPITLSPFLWLDAADTSTITAVSDAVSQWNDKSGNNRHVSQGTAAAQPRTGDLVNSRNALFFDGGDSLTRSAAGFPSTGARTLFAVARYTGSASFYQHIAIWGNTTITLNSSFGLTTFLDGTAYKGRLHYFVNNSSPMTTQTLRTQNAHQLTATYDGTGTSQIFANGQAGQTLSATVTTAVNGSFLVGDRTWTSGEQWTGHICEVILYDRALTAGEQTTVENYLRTKWGTY